MSDRKSWVDLKIKFSKWLPQFWLWLLTQALPTWLYGCIECIRSQVNWWSHHHLPILCRNLLLSIDHVNFMNHVYNQCDLVHSLASLAGKILHRSYGKVYILCPNFRINPRITKVKAGQVLRCAPFHHIKNFTKIGQCNLQKI